MPINLRSSKNGRRNDTPSSSIASSELIGIHFQRDPRWECLSPMPLLVILFIFAAILFAISIATLLDDENPLQEPLPSNVWSLLIVAMAPISVLHSAVDALCYYLHSLRPAYVLALSCTLMVAWVLVVGFGAYCMHQAIEAGCLTRACDYAQAQFSFSVFILLSYILMVLFASRAQEHVLRKLSEERRALTRTVKELQQSQPFRMQQVLHEQAVCSRCRAHARSEDFEYQQRDLERGSASPPGYVRSHHSASPHSFRWNFARPRASAVAVANDEAERLQLPQCLGPPPSPELPPLVVKERPDPAVLTGDAPLPNTPRRVSYSLPSGETLPQRRVSYTVPHDQH